MKNDENRCPNPSGRPASKGKTEGKKEKVVGLIDFKGKNPRGPHGKSNDLTRLSTKRLIPLVTEKSNRMSPRRCPASPPRRSVSRSPAPTRGDRSRRPRESLKSPTPVKKSSESVRTRQNYPELDSKISRKTLPCPDSDDYLAECVQRGYLVLEEIGRGSYARVHRALFEPTGTEVALKVYRKSGLTPTRESSLKHELSVLLKLDHPNIVKFIDCFTSKTHVFLVTELVNGHNLYSSFKRGFEDLGLADASKDTLRRFARRVMRQIFAAVHYLHRRMINHRDIKLDNIVFDAAAGVAKLIDFGFSKVVAPETPEVLTCGTPTYMSPEAVLRTESITLQSDIWALGVVYYALVFHRFPFTGKTDTELYAAIANQPLLLPKWLPDDEKAFFAGLFERDWQERTTIFQIAKDWL